MEDANLCYNVDKIKQETKKKKGKEKNEFYYVVTHIRW